MSFSTLRICLLDPCTREENRLLDPPSYVNWPGPFIRRCWRSAPRRCRVRTRSLARFVICCLIQIHAPMLQLRFDMHVSQMHDQPVANSGSGNDRRMGYAHHRCQPHGSMVIHGLQTLDVVGIDVFKTCNMMLLLAI